MSIIHDALKKAQEERKKESPELVYTQWDQKKKSRIYGYAAIAIVAAGFFGYLYYPGFHKSQATATSITVKATPAASVSASSQGASKPSVPAELHASPAQKTQEEKRGPADDRSREETIAGTGLNEKGGAKDYTSKEKHRGIREGSDPVLSKPVQSMPLLAKDDADTPKTVHPERTKNRPKQVDSKENTELLYNKALSEQQSGNNAEAKSIYKKILAIYPGHVESLNNLGVIAMNEGNSPEALVYFKSILDHNKDYPKAYNNMGLVLMKDNNMGLAEEYFRKAVALEPASVEPYLNLAALLRSQKKYQEAAKVLEVPLFQKKLQEPALFLSYAVIQDSIGRNDEASKYYRYYLSSIQSPEKRTDIFERLKYLEKSR